MSETRPKLLVIEDDPGLQAQLKWAYEDFEVIVAGDRPGAMAALRSDASGLAPATLGASLTRALAGLAVLLVINVVLIRLRAKSSTGN